MFGFDIVVTSTTVQDLEIDPEAADFIHPPYPDDYSEDEEEDGAQYKDGTEADYYILPYNKRETDRLDLQHDIQRIIMQDKLYAAPLNPDTANVLDIGGGTGRWAIEFATENPNSKVTSTDIILQEHYPNKPDNVEFILADAEKPWDFPHKFDYIHLRDLMVCFTDQKAVYKQAYEWVAPGGYCSISDCMLPLKCNDGTLEGTKLDQWFKLCVEAATKIGRPWSNIPKYAGWMKEFGYEDVTEIEYHLPTNDWSMGEMDKKIGKLMMRNLSIVMYSTVPLLRYILGMDATTVKELFDGARIDARNRNIHAYLPVVVHWGRKPDNS